MSVLALVSLGGCGDVLAPELPVQFRDLAVGAHHACALDVGGTPWCWGRGDAGALGTGGRGDEHRATAVAIPDTLSFLEIAAGGDQTCALTASGIAYCWGTAASVRGGESLVPTAVEGAPAFVAISAGYGHACGLTAAGEAYCWGSGERGQLGRGDALTSTDPAPVAGALRFTGISAGARHTCGVADTGAGYCWGANDEGQLGDGTLVDRPAPAAIAGYTFTRLDAGFANTCGLAGEALCWGAAGNGQPGDYNYWPQRPPEPRPITVAGSYPFTSLRAGHLVICGVPAGRAQGLCWGNGEFGQLGNGRTEDQASPHWVTLHPGHLHSSDALHFRLVDPSGVRHTCGLSVEAAVFCWGTGHRGELGSGGTFTAVPQRVRVTDQ